MVKKIVVIIVSIVLSVAIFMPKDKLYFLAEEKLSSYGIEINEKLIEDKLFELSLSGLSVFYNGIKVATVDEIHIYTFVVYNRCDIVGLHIDKAIDKNLSEDDIKASLVYSILNYKTANITIKGEDIKADGFISMEKFFIKFDEVNNGLKNMLIKDKTNGWYYEEKFTK